MSNDRLNVLPYPVYLSRDPNADPLEKPVSGEFEEVHLVVVLHGGGPRNSCDVNGCRELAEEYGSCIFHAQTREANRLIDAYQRKTALCEQQHCRKEECGRCDALAAQYKTCSVPGCLQRWDFGGDPVLCYAHRRFCQVAGCPNKSQWDRPKPGYCRRHSHLYGVAGGTVAPSGPPPRNAPPIQMECSVRFCSEDAELRNDDGLCATHHVFGLQVPNLGYFGVLFRNEDFESYLFTTVPRVGHEMELLWAMGYRVSRAWHAVPKDTERRLTAMIQHLHTEPTAPYGSKHWRKTIPYSAISESDLISRLTDLLDGAEMVVKEPSDWDPFIAPSGESGLG